MLPSEELGVEKTSVLQTGGEPTRFLSVCSDTGRHHDLPQYTSAGSTHYSTITGGSRPVLPAYHIATSVALEFHLPQAANVNCLDAR